MSRRIVKVLASSLVLVAVLTGCKKEDPQPVVKPSSSSKPAPVIEMTEMIDTIPNMTLLSEHTPRNQLEETEFEYLLPNGIRIPPYKATNAMPTVSLGGVYTLQVSGNWTMVASGNKMNLFHASGISIQLVHNKLNTKFDLSDIQTELTRFCDGFVLTDDFSTKSIFLGNREVGQQVALNIPHDDKVLHIEAGIIDANRECLVYTISYFAEDAIATYEDLVMNLMTSMQAKNQDIIIK